MSRGKPLVKFDIGHDTKVDNSTFLKLHHHLIRKRALHENSSLFAKGNSIVEFGSLSDGILIGRNMTNSSLTAVCTNDKASVVAEALSEILGKDIGSNCSITRYNEDEEIFIKYDQLLDTVWDVGKMRPNIREALMKNVNAFLKFCEFEDCDDIKDIVLTGSIANYNWTELSDFDVHLLVDMDALMQKYGEKFKLLCDVQRRLYQMRYDIMIDGHEVELYFEDENEVHVSTGIYSIQNNKWIIQPKVMETTIDSDERDELMNKWVTDIKSLLADESATSVAYDLMIKKLVNFRKAGLATKGELSLPNIIFKELRRDGYIDDLNDARNKRIEDYLSR